MISYIRTRIREYVAPNHCLSCHTRIWQAGIAELWRRGDGQRESGAFLLGQRQHGRAAIQRFIFYDDVEPGCLATGIVRLDGTGFGQLWQICRTLHLEVIADIHTHPERAYQSASDRAHPMIAQAGHLAIIIPHFARPPVKIAHLGIFLYQGTHRWEDLSAVAPAFLYIGRWG
jgi:proteasome lid subunit RPN8/RPN11